MSQISATKKLVEKKYHYPLYGEDILRLNSSMTEQDNNTEPPVTFDDLLLTVGKTQNRDAFVRLFEHFAPRIKSFLMKGGLTPEEADEMAQETMLAVWNKAGSFNPEKAAASTWIYTIARNRKIDFFRKRTGRETPINDALPLPDNSLEKIDDALEREQTKNEIASALDSLPPAQALLVKKSFFEHKPHQEIADETGLPLGTVKSRIRLALEKLRYQLEKGDK